MRILALVVAVACGGCLLIPDAKPPRTGTRRTGEPLRIVDDVKVWNTVSRDKVGELRYEDENGDSLGRSDLYANQRHTHVKFVWFPVQGYEVVPDEDFFRIAGDRDALARTLKRRDKLQTWNFRGRVMLASGIAAVVLASLVGPDESPATILTVVGGAAVAATGWYLCYWSHDQMLPENHAVDRSIAVEAAERYNAQHGRKVGLQMSRSF